jgi:hypothetical protein
MGDHARKRTADDDGDDSEDERLRDLEKYVALDRHGAPPEEREGAMPRQRGL